MVLKLFSQTRPAIPEYEVLEKVGEGGMGAVYKGRHRATGRAVAIKFITAELAEDFEVTQRFEQEFRVASKLDHPNIVQVLDFCRSPESMYLIMEYIDGPNLGRRIDAHGPLAEAEAIALITQVAQALDYAHQHWIIHRDVKPDNVLLQGNGLVKLTDFGLVKDLIGDRHLTEPLSKLGTTHFMAPEQSYDAKRVDHRCDVYSLAATLYMAVTGKMPFWNCRSLMDLTQQVMQGSFTPPRQLVPTLSEEVEEAIRRAMSPDPAQRPASCGEFVQGLKRHRKEPLASPSPAEEGGHRAAPRFPHGAGTSCLVSTSLHAENAEAGERWPAFVQDLSEGGFALVVGRRLEAGSIVAVDFYPPGGKAAETLGGRVVYVQPSSYGHWRIGCVFQQRLSPEAVQALL